jgi:hypothetical protein
VLRYSKFPEGAAEYFTEETMRKRKLLNESSTDRELAPSE